MINLEEQIITCKGETENIQEYEVWFQTPKGLCQDINDAIESCRSLDLDPNTCIFPIPVATSASMYEILIK